MSLSDKDKLIAYSEWLDSEGAISADDDRSHEELVLDFIRS